MDINKDRKPLRTPRKDEEDFMTTPTWLKVGLGVSLMASIGLLSFTVWAVYELVQWVITK